MLEQYQKFTSLNWPTDNYELTQEEATILNWSLGLGGEVGEITELIKHHIFYKEPLNKMELVKEMGDVLWYLSSLATSFDVSLEDVVNLNVAKLSHRYQNGFEEKANRERHNSELKFNETLTYKNLENAILRQPKLINVIFIGPDGSGKTTISKKVTEQLNLLFQEEKFTYYKCSYQTENKIDASIKLLEEEYNMIYDRFFFPDDLVYSKVKQLPTKEIESTWNKVVALLGITNTIFIYVTAGVETLVERSSSWKDDYITVEDLPKIIKEYERILATMQKQGLKVVEVETSSIATGTVQYINLIDQICQYIVKFRENVDEEEEQIITL